MTDYSKMPFHPTMEKIVEILMKKTQNDDPMFFRLMVSYFFCKVTSMMRAAVQIADTQTIPVNMYAINLAPSGSGKGHSVNIMEEQVIQTFRQDFLGSTFPELAERNLAKLGLERAAKIGSSGDPDDETARAQLEFDEMGALLFSFDSGTSAAVKQMRVKLLMAKAGSMNMEIDEIGSNLLGNSEVLNTFLELFDTGRIKQKLIKNTRENVRSEDLFGSTPTNMLLFGTPYKLLNGSKTEDEFYDFLEIGYARRCFFGLSRIRKARANQTAQDIYDIYNDAGSISYLTNLASQIGLLADKSNFNQVIRMKKDVSLALFEYRLHCTSIGDSLSEYEEIRKAEITHRYFKVAKLAAAYAFIDRSMYVKMSHLENAIAMAEQSGESFAEILNRDMAHVKLANYLSLIGREMTHAELLENLPFYKGTEPQKRDMVSMAIAHGYKNNIVITREMIDGIEFLSGKSVPETDLNKITLSAGKDITTGFATHVVPFNRLHHLVAISGYHWVNHALRDAYRDEAHVVPGFNIIVLDVEKSVSIDMAKYLLKDYKYLLHTTKRHTESEHRFRVILPISHTLALEGKDFKEFMGNIFDWLPFEVDRATGQRARKWLTNKGQYWYNDGELIDSLQFVPKTKKADEYKAVLANQSDWSNLERWFINNTADGNRNHNLMRYAFALLDMGQDIASIQNNVLALNRKLESPLTETEVLSTVIATATRKFHTKGDA